MSAAQTRSNADADLLQQLESAGSGGAPVQAWVRLKPKGPSQDAASPRETETSTQAVVKRVAQRVGQPAHSLKVLPNLGAFIVSGSPDFVRELIHQPEIESARSTNQPLTLIQPVESREVSLPRPSRRPARSAARRKRRPRR